MASTKLAEVPASNVEGTARLNARHVPLPGQPLDTLDRPYPPPANPDALLSTVRACAHGVFGAWSLTGPNLRTAPCDDNCYDNKFDAGAVFLDGQPQVWCLAFSVDEHCFDRADQ